MSKIVCFVLLALAAAVPAAYAQSSAQANASVASGVSSQVESFWQELFDGTAYSSGFISSLSDLTDLQQKLQIPESDTNFIKTLLPGNVSSEISDTVDQALLSGMELYDKLDAEFCTPAYLQKGVKYPSECSGPTYTFEINGGYCYIVTETKAVTCVKPTVTLNMDPGVCSLKYTTPTTVFDKECKYTKLFGTPDSGVLASYNSTTIDLSQIYNVTKTDDMSDVWKNFLDLATPTSSASAAASVAASGQECTSP